MNLLHEFGDWSVENVSAGIQNTLICFEMLLAAIAHRYAFPYQGYAGKERPHGLKQAFLQDNFAIEDAVSDFNQVAPGRILLPSNFKAGGNVAAESESQASKRTESMLDEGEQQARILPPKAAAVFAAMSGNKHPNSGEEKTPDYGDLDVTTGMYSEL